MIRDAITCDQVNCQALYLEPVADSYAAPGYDPHPTRAEDVLEFEQLVDLAGWTRGKDGHTCPACAKGNGPVYERGECPRCGGRTFDRSSGTHCQYCNHAEPHHDDVEEVF